MGQVAQPSPWTRGPPQSGQRGWRESWSRSWVAGDVVSIVAMVYLHGVARVF